MHKPELCINAEAHACDHAAIRLQVEVVADLSVHAGHPQLVEPETFYSIALLHSYIHFMV